MMYSPTGFGKRNVYSAKNNIRTICFLCFAPNARNVTIMGDFNDWDPASHPMKQLADKAWHLDVPLNHGHHQYMFVVDGQPTLDPRASGISRNAKNERVSVIAVS